MSIRYSVDLDELKFRHSFSENGYIVVEDVFSSDEVNEMRDAMAQIVATINPEVGPKATFTTYDEDKHLSDQYFLDSVDNISHFYEEGSVDPTTGSLLVPKELAFNKIGHALHWLDPVFNKFTFHQKIKHISKLMGLTCPQVAQSMYIFKQPKLTKTHENAVTDHIDSTFIHIDSPNGVLLGIWIALDDATIENGCLWFIPGSHKNLSSTNEPYRFARTRTKERKQDNNVPLLEFIGPKPEYDKSKFIPVQVKKGSLVLIDGNVVHKSETNTSSQSRHVYTFHLVQSSEWSGLNWLQETDTYQFPFLYENFQE